MNSTPEKSCPQCGGPLPDDALEGICPRCLMRMNLAEPTVMDHEAAPKAKKPKAPTPEEIAPLFPQLEILELIGQGGMGAVYKARQTDLDRIVALKILPREIGDAPGFADRFAREARALAKLNHPDIVTLYEFGKCSASGPLASESAGGAHAPLYYFLMEYVDGLNLRRLLQNGRIEPREALAIVPQICDALQYAHDHGIVHRDIKPENILLDRRGLVKVADFGLAKMVGNYPLSSSDGERGGEGGDPLLTEAGKVMGTPQYMSPEQIKAPGQVDHRADIYALGVVFYQMLTGELPGKPLLPPSRACGKVRIDVRLDEVVLRALEQKPELRYQQASLLKTRIETIASTPADAPNQRAINEAEWNNSANWTGPKWLSLYFSKKDSRAWAPKQIPALGWTINLGHPRGAMALMAIVAAILVLQGAGTVAVMHLASDGGVRAANYSAFVPVVIGVIVLDALILLGLWRAVSHRTRHARGPSGNWLWIALAALMVAGSVGIALWGERLLTDSRYTVTNVGEGVVTIATEGKEGLLQLGPNGTGYFDPDSRLRIGDIQIVGGRRLEVLNTGTNMIHIAQLESDGVEVIMTLAEGGTGYFDKHGTITIGTSTSDDAEGVLPLIRIGEGKESATLRYKVQPPESRPLAAPQSPQSMPTATPHGERSEPLLPRFAWGDCVAIWHVEQSPKFALFVMEGRIHTYPTHLISRLAALQKQNPFSVLPVRLGPPGWAAAKGREGVRDLELQSSLPSSTRFVMGEPLSELPLVMDDGLYTTSVPVWTTNLPSILDFVDGSTASLITPRNLGISDSESLHGTNPVIDGWDAYVPASADRLVFPSSSVLLPATPEDWRPNRNTPDVLLQKITALIRRRERAAPHGSPVKSLSVEQRDGAWMLTQSGALLLLRVERDLDQSTALRVVWRRVSQATHH